MRTLRNTNPLLLKELVSVLNQDYKASVSIIRPSDIAREISRDASAKKIFGVLEGLLYLYKDRPRQLNLDNILRVMKKVAVGDDPLTELVRAMEIEWKQRRRNSRGLLQLK